MSGRARVSSASGEPVISKATSTPWPSVHSMRDACDFIGSRPVRRTECLSQSKPGGSDVARDDDFGAQRSCPGCRGHSEHAAAHHQHASAGERAGRLDAAATVAPATICGTGRGVGQGCRHAEDRVPGASTSGRRARRSARGRGGAARGRTWSAARTSAEGAGGNRNTRRSSRRRPR